ncbi:activity-dependent neuroprotector homeobox a [Kryptolebias marmoratus]|uniref:Activity-dependent neuroprotector homeobox a n=1 Tax=Kryptolebias marmoratus TaxID=37003 RepID=A0A3Q3BEC8_KRYMA|nr:activity-dependent neuroprotector homeobox a [Kryptolebias marmoratus]
MYQLPVNNLARIRRARKQVKKSLEDIGLEFCKEVAEEFKEFSPDEQLVKETECVDICTWNPPFSKTQEYRSKPFCCAECSFSSKYYSGYRNHFRNVHRRLLDDQILLNCPYCSFIANKRTLEMHVKIFHIPSSKQQNYLNSRGTVLGTKTNLTNAVQKVEKAMYFCKKCTFRDSLYNVVKRHIYREHFRHVVSPYFGMVSKSSVRNGACSINGNNIFCKQCQFSTRSYEVLVQHVLEYHERISAQVTSMIAHANISVPISQPFPVMNQKTRLVSKGSTRRSDPIAQPVIGYLKPVAAPAKSQSVIQTDQMHATSPVSNAVAENNQTGVNTAQTQKWKICTVCNELFPENLYSAHFESAHKAKKVWALAKYIVKIHNFTSKCLVCNRYLPSNTLLNHMLIHGLTCPQCHSIFHSVEKLMGHEAQSHPGEFVGPTDASPLTFDLTIKQGTPRNIQLAILTFNMKDSVNGQDQSVPGLKNLPPLGRVPPAKMGKYNEPHGLASIFHNTEVRKTVCPLCFTVIKGPITDALALHLRERHQVLQTMHPVEKKMTYKCIHCLGVYTSNMVASTITLHLVQCRAVGRNHVSQGFKSAMALNSSGVGVPKRRLPTLGSPSPKRMKTSKGCDVYGGNNGLALDTKGYGNKTYLAKKEFLTTYFNLRPYPTPDEELKLSANLNMWRSEVASHFASKRNICLRSCKMKKASVKLGFDMHAVKTVKHHMIFDDERLVGISTARSAASKTITSHTKQKQCKLPNHALQLSTCTETISIDSDSEEETEKPPAENKGQENLTMASKQEDTDDSSAEKSSLQDGKENICMIFESGTPPENEESKDQDFKDQKDMTTHADADEPSAEKSSSQDGGDDVCISFETKTPPAENVKSKDQENLTEETKPEDVDDPSTEDTVLQDVKDDICMTFETEMPPEEEESRDQENLTEEDKYEDGDDPYTEKSSLQDERENVCITFETETPPSENVESNQQEDLIQETKLKDMDDYSTEKSSLQDEGDNVFMAFETEMPPEDMDSEDQENLTEETQHENTDDPLAQNVLQDGNENVCMTFETETPPENVEPEDQENLTEENQHEDTDDTLENILQAGVDNVPMAFETEMPAENVEAKEQEHLTEETEHQDGDEPLTDKSSLQDGGDNICMTFEMETPPENMEFEDQENLTETQHEDTDDPLAENVWQDEKEDVCMMFETETPPENMESEDLTEETQYQDGDDHLAEESVSRDGEENACMTFETEAPPENVESEDQANLTAETEHVDTEGPST